MTRLEKIAMQARITAMAMPIFDGVQSPENMGLIRRCTHDFLWNAEVGCRVCLTRESGYHSSGWWKNPDYERCLHLSVSFVELDGRPAHHEIKWSQRMAKKVFSDHADKLWVESPATYAGRAAGVWHYRLFCNPNWSPLMPRGEVYSRDWTPPDWQSFSEVTAARAA